MPPTKNMKSISTTDVAVRKIVSEVKAILGKGKMPKDLKPSFLRYINLAIEELEIENESALECLTVAQIKSIAREVHQCWLGQGTRREVLNAYFELSTRGEEILMFVDIDLAWEHVVNKMEVFWLENDLVIPKFSAFKSLQDRNPICEALLT